ncbi:multidrug resistance efflux pump [Prosthecobacter fusiformis]|uniref:Multidrug resistance efflux pump n=1 Tax=Prosthecobacter fusiformis TaxID=48464 RepID=A0A4R7RKP8_9BACT|nr:efflux RND transporter periplasmic adaptor subunit [Prosthecobacter fusiformis]TDU63213.1 multidrug resistance efflux pump [Prosthecobacter fusiformis]
MKKGKSKIWIYGGAAVAVIAIGAYLFSGSTSQGEDVPTFTVQKGPLAINVLQGGEIRALQNFELKSEIETPTKILSIIPEGYLVTEEDVKEGKVLVELDNSDLKTRIQDHEIQFQGTVAAYIDADEGREIQRSENQSLVRDMKETSIFALMDFEKYLGSDLTTKLLAVSLLPKDAAEFDKFASTLESQANAQLEAGTNISAVGEAKKDTKSLLKKTIGKPITERIDFSPYLEAQSGGDGEAQQMLRQLEDELLLRKSELAVSKQKVEASQRLAARDFISKTQLENDQVNFEKVSLAVKTAETELALFKKYAFSKQCAQLLSAYRESLTKLQRTVRANRSKMAQAETRFTTAKRRYEMELAKKEDLDRQLKACMMRAVQPGLVAYGNLNASASARFNESIEEGTNVRFRQTVLTIPNMSQMGVHVNIHESQVKKVRVGQPALITVDAEPGVVLQGRVAELAVLPDSASSRYTPNLKVYPASVHILGTHPWMKPGMNAKVEVLVDQLAEVVFVPVQSIEVENDSHYCYVTVGGGLERRPVKTGLFNDEFIEVRTGLQVGELVALALPKKLVPENKAGPSIPGIPDEEPVAPVKPKGKAKPKDVAAIVK